jgi:hypothetical protein
MRHAASVSVPPPISVPASTLASAASPGLVSSTTNGHDCHLVSFGATVAAERRIARLKRSVWAGGTLHAMGEIAGSLSVCWFVTLTYRGVDDWRPQHIAGAIRRLRKWCKRSAMKCRYVWVAELQQRGAVHYHLLAWLPKGVPMPHWDAADLGPAWWPHGMTNTQPAKAGVGYLMKYLSKLGEFHRFPKGLRLYGMGGLTDDGRSIRAWLNLPEWVKRDHGVGEARRRKAGIANAASGELLASPWKVKRVPHGLQVSLARELSPRFHDGAYSTWPRTVN